MQKFYKGRTDNHLTWVMVDATDFATPESAMSAAAKIKIYGKLRADNTVYFVSSGTGSLTNDIKHVGASVLGIYTIGLVKADLSDASAAWYDQYVISLSATGAAYQTLVVDGGIDDSNLSAIVSDLTSALLVANSAASDAASAATQANSRILLCQSRISDAQSYLIVLSDLISGIYSQSSDLSSDLKSYLAVMSDVQSDFYSDFQSRVPKLVATNSDLVSQASDLKSAIAAGPTPTITASDMSDIASRVGVLLSAAQSDMQSQLSDLHSDLKSYLAVMSDVLSDVQSDFQSRVPKLVATNSQLSDLHSDLRSYLVVMSGIQSDIYSGLSDFQSDFGSRVPKLVATNSDLVSQASDIKSAVLAVTATVGASDISDIASAVWANTVGTRVDSRILVAQSYLSDIRSNVSDMQSDFQSRVPKLVATNSDLVSQASDLKSAIGAITVTLTASDISDIASAVLAGAAGVSASDMSDIASRVWATAEGTRVDSRILVAQSYLSDIRSNVSDMQSDFQSRVPKLVATNSDLVSQASDLKSAITVNQSSLSDIYSLLSDVSSDLAVMSGIQSDIYSHVIATSGVVSDIYSNLAAGVAVGASDLSDLRSAIIANGMQAAGAEPTTVFGHTGTLASKLDWLGAVARNKITQTATVQSLRNDADNADIASAAVSDDGVTFTRDEFG